MLWLRRCFALAWVGLVHLEGVTASCLPEAVPISSRRNLTNAQGESYPLGVLEDSNVALMEIFSQIIQILIAEVLGYNDPWPVLISSIHDAALVS
ncbi:hypothetical protein AK812_SmicGene19164 [Symbiodinium microadriaticum]|uniref:Secreted protein n=1 Tax=Symbiodinium microadriaticum TaxID=2951 RepID=A0A1Q9DTB2_SYMMI|nr:hypothetical protein AK812_SmicGene19164 [Symbiodinium microadriaticum]